jgi:hypothetical protein
LYTAQADLLFNSNYVRIKAQSNLNAFKNNLVLNDALINQNIPVK